MSTKSGRTTAVYPRSRGEHVLTLTEWISSTGLSPLARGTPSSRPYHWEGSRFIPARAGNTGGDHRHRGIRRGLSPLARGTQKEKSGSYRHRRFIPARAGNTERPVVSTGRGPVYPRSRGEHPTTHFIVNAYCGLSPLARGTRDLVNAVADHLRFIPARAGNTLSVTSCLIYYLLANKIPPKNRSKKQHHKER